MFELTPIWELFFVVSRLFPPVHSLGFLHSRVVSFNWVRTFLFFHCAIVHVSVATVIVAAFRCYGGLGWLGDIEHLVTSVSCRSRCTRGSFRYLLHVRDNASSISELLERLLFFFEGPLHPWLFNFIQERAVVF